MLVKNSAAGPADDAAVSDACRCLIKDDCITVIRTVGIGEFGVVQQAVWTKDHAHQVSLHRVSVCLSVCLSVTSFLGLCLISQDKTSILLGSLAAEYTVEVHRIKMIKCKI